MLRCHRKEKRHRMSDSPALDVAPIIALLQEGQTDQLRELLRALPRQTVLRLFGPAQPQQAAHLAAWMMAIAPQPGADLHRAWARVVTAHPQPTPLISAAQDWYRNPRSYPAVRALMRRTTPATPPEVPGRRFSRWRHDLSESIAKNHSLIRPTQWTDEGDGVEPDADALDQTQAAVMVRLLRLLLLMPDEAWLAETLIPALRDEILAWVAGGDALMKGQGNKTAR